LEKEHRRALEQMSKSRLIDLILEAIYHGGDISLHGSDL
jgi:hypothetical protein